VLPGVLVLAGLGAGATTASATTYEVTSSADRGAHTLRWAISSANANVGSDLITFDVGGATPHQISLRSDLPTITDPVEIDGYTQPGALASPDAATPAEPQIVIDAALATRGLRLETDGSTVRGLVIQAADGGQGAFFLADGIQVEGDVNHVVGNFIGTDATGALAVRNIGDGIQVEGDGNVIGGVSPEERNVISSNPDNVHVYTGTGNQILGNLIGTDANGAAALGGGGGIVVDSDQNQIGESATGAGNVISGNLTGLELLGDSNTVEGNMIGTTPGGDQKLANNYDGVEISGDDNVIGGAANGQPNVISANGWHGIWIDHAAVGDPAEGNRIEGNLIGTDLTGTQPLGNDGDGVRVWNSASNTIGGVRPGTGNVIAANGDEGIAIEDKGDPADDNRILGNRIGTDASGALDLGNGEQGVLIAANHTHVGNGGATGENIIAFNAEQAVEVAFTGADNTIRHNSFAHNGDARAIYLQPSGGGNGSVNDPLDADSGGNGLQNYPVITSAIRSGATTTVAFTLDSLPSTAYHVELYGDPIYASITGGDQGCGQGKTWLGSIKVTTDATGHADDEINTTTPFVFVRATATQTNSSTSQTSPCKTVALTPPPL
jgi:hypothetical protein